jgi:putative glutamine amidotransferase
MIIGITDCGAKHPIYEQWILEQSLSDNVPQIEVIRLGYKFNNFEQIKQCDGVVLTGGEDIHPKYYGKPEAIGLCNPDFMDEQRDEFEWKVCEYIFKNAVPVLGICRGLQLVNVFLGGTLIPDIPTAGMSDHSKFYEGKDRYHPVEILHDSELSKITNIVFGEINSAHHQSAKTIAKPLKINALSEDKIVEGLEWASNSPEKQSHYLMLVQWHPERIINAEYNYFSYKIRQHFIKYIQSNTLK